MGRITKAKKMYKFPFDTEEEFQGMYLVDYKLDFHILNKRAIVLHNAKAVVEINTPYPPFPDLRWQNERIFITVRGVTDTKSFGNIGDDLL